MKTILLLAAAAALVIFAALGVACKNSGGNALTLEEYFSKLDTIQNNTDAAFATQDAAEPAQDADEAELASFLKDSTQGTVGTLRDAADKAGNLKPPEEAATAHGDLVAALTDTADVLAGIANSVPDTLTLAELQDAGTTYFSGEDLSAAYDALTTSCNALEKIASDNGITVDLACGE